MNLRLLLLRSVQANTPARAADRRPEFSVVFKRRTNVKRLRLDLFSIALTIILNREADLCAERSIGQCGLLAAIRCGCTLNQREIGNRAAAVPDDADIGL